MTSDGLPEDELAACLAVGDHPSLTTPVARLVVPALGVDHRRRQSAYSHRYGKKGAPIRRAQTGEATHPWPDWPHLADRAEQG